jgi:hypothetical protein
MIDQVIEQLSMKEGFYSEPGSVTEVQIDEMERELEVTLPDSYRRFLLDYSFIEWFGHVVCGICEDNECSATYFTKKARQMDLPDPGFVRIPQEAVVIEPYAGGGSYILFCKESDRAGEVALFEHDALGKEVESWSSFEDYLRYKLSVSR